MSDRIVDITYKTTGYEIGEKITGIKEKMVTFNILLKSGEYVKVVINIHQPLSEIYADICALLMDSH